MLSKRAIDEYKQICQEEFGQVPSEDIVIEQATALLSLINAVYRPIKHKWLEDYDKPRKQ
ncbi:MAG: hypothetical protein PHY26_03620 [Bacilli bacterium]|nr:hypothetical protein [Bacilli bacterium]MDD3502107.1 hypothetical protein [Candidatus Cloacimonadota bacterium]